MSDVDLHKLANTPGAGKARKALMKAGLWDDRADKPMKLWRVELRFTRLVDARDEDEAMEKAEEESEELYVEAIEAECEDD